MTLDSLPDLEYKRVVSCKDSFHGTDVLAVSEHGAPGRRPNIHAHFVGRSKGGRPRYPADPRRRGRPKHSHRGHPAWFDRNYRGAKATNVMVIPAGKLANAAGFPQDFVCQVTAEIQHPGPMFLTCYIGGERVARRALFFAEIPLSELSPDQAMAELERQNSS